MKALAWEVPSYLRKLPSVVMHPFFSGSRACGGDAGCCGIIGGCFLVPTIKCVDMSQPSDEHK
jgi:hypothetical protein